MNKDDEIARLWEHKKVDAQTIQEQSDLIELLKAKLAESEEKLKAMETLREMINEDSKLNFRRYIDTLAKNEQLEQQLADKDEEIKNLKEQFDVFTIKNAFKYQNVIEKSKMQFAIDYAIEQLEELRLSFICNYHDNISWIDDRENSCCLNLTTTIYNTTIDIFNNQIEELKKEMK